MAANFSHTSSRARKASHVHTPIPHAALNQTKTIKGFAQGHVGRSVHVGRVGHAGFSGRAARAGGAVHTGAVHTNLHTRAHAPHLQPRSNFAGGRGGRGMLSPLSHLFGVINTLLAHTYNKLSGFKTTYGRFKGPVYLLQLVPALLLVLFGIVVIYTASLSIPKASFIRHIGGVVVGAAAAFALWRYDYRVFARASLALLIADVVLILLPLIPGFGVSAKGLTGWVKLPLIGLNFQPSELAKIVTILLMASLGAGYNGKIDTLKSYIKLCAVLSIPFILILLQPDLGTGLILLVVGATIIIASGAKKSWVIITILALIMVITLVIVMSMTPGLPHILKQYQMNRLIVFMDSSVDPAGFGYNLQQAKIAVGSGGIWGKGIGGASQAGSGFLPEAHTDFVFALLAEEFGFAGASLLLILFAAIIFSTLALAGRVDSPFGKLILVGIAMMWCFQLLQNVGMCIGIMPITGIPLPFISFGSSSMVAQLMSIGLVQSVWRHIPKSA